ERSALASRVAAGEEPVVSSECHGPDGVLGCVVADLQLAVIEVSRQRRPSRAGIADGAGEIALARDALQLGIEPGRQLVEPRLRQALADVARCSGGAPLICLSMSNSAPIFS